MKKVTGLGGVFFKCNDPKGMNDWYAKNLGLGNSEWGTTFEWREADDPEKKDPHPGARFRRIPNISIRRQSLL